MSMFVSFHGDLESKGAIGKSKKHPTYHYGNQKYEYYILKDLKTQSLVQLTAARLLIGDPLWSPDGGWIDTYFHYTTATNSQSI